jgi:hypothetical protein
MFNTTNTKLSPLAIQDAERAIIEAVKLHPGVMSPIMLDHYLRGEVLGRMSEKGLLDSPYFGACADLDVMAVATIIDAAMQKHPIKRTPGFYPGLFWDGTDEYVSPADVAIAPVEVPNPALTNPLGLPGQAMAELDSAIATLDRIAASPRTMGVTNPLLVDLLADVRDRINAARGYNDAR